MTTTRDRVTAAALTGLTTAAYYAVPDLTTSRAARGWLRAAFLVAGGAVHAWVSRDDIAEAREGWRDALAHLRDRAADGTAPGADSTAPGAGSGAEGTTPGADEPAPDAPAGSRLPAPARAAVAAAVGAAVLAGSVALTVAGERWLYRRAETRAAAGVRFAHVRQGLVLGTLSAALFALPDHGPDVTPDDDHAGADRPADARDDAGADGVEGDAA